MSTPVQDDAQWSLPFDGKTFDFRLDGERLGRQIRAVRDYMLNLKGGSATVEEISTALGFPQCSVSARLRDLRKPKFGGYTVEAHRITENGLYAYRVIQPEIPHQECWHCGGRRSCNCIVCALDEGYEIKPGPCTVCVIRRRSTDL